MQFTSNSHYMGENKVYINLNWYWFPVEPTQLHLNTSPLKCNVLAFLLKGRAKDPLVGARENKMNTRDLKASFCLHFFLHIALTTLILECGCVMGAIIHL